MKGVTQSYVMRIAPWAIPILTIGIFLFDLFTPVGVAVAMLYALPLLLSFFTWRDRDPLYVALGATGLIWLDLFLKPPGISIPYGAFNRALGTLVLWGVAVGLTHYKQMQRGLGLAEAAKTEALSKQEAAIAARQLAEASATGAIHRESQTARELLMSSLRLEGIIRSAMDAIITIDERQQVLLFNEAAEQMFRCPAQEAIGRSIDKFIPARFRDAHHRHVGVFGHSGATSRKMGELGAVVGLRSDGEEFPIEAAISHISVEGKRFFTVIIRDIGERRRMEEQLRRTERIAELGTLASGMAHEIGTPMNVILGRAEYLLDRVREEPVRKGLQTIVAQVERITRVMNQLLSFARRKAPQRNPLALQDVIDNSLEMFQERFARSQVQVERQVLDRTPMALADSDQMNQVLINLIMNALHAMPNGGILRIGLQPDGEMIKLTVGDTGHGIPPEALKKVFEPFFTTKEFGKGTGLGLTVVKGIIEEHHGSIAVESEEGKGTTFTIFLPVAERQP